MDVVFGSAKGGEDLSLERYTIRIRVSCRENQKNGFFLIAIEMLLTNDYLLERMNLGLDGVGPGTLRVEQVGDKADGVPKPCIRGEIKTAPRWRGEVWTYVSTGIQF